MTRRRHILPIIILSLLCFMAAGCGDSNDEFVFTNTQQPAFGTPAGLAFQTIPARTAGVVFAPLQVAIVDSGGRIVTNATNPVTISLNNPGAATIMGTLTRNAVNGIATFNDITVDRVGNYTFQASSPGLQGTASVGFAITPATSSQLSFSVQPSNTNINQTFNPSVVVESRDALGNLTDTQVTMTINGKPTLNGTTVRNTVNGLATFNDLTVGTGGSNYTLTATSSTGAMVTSNTFTVQSPFNGLVISDRNNQRLVQIDDFAGTNQMVLTHSGVFNWGVAVSASGAIFTTFTTTGQVAMYDNIADTTATTLGGFNQPTGLTIDNQGRLLIADFGNNRIVRVDNIAGDNMVIYSGPVGNTFSTPVNLAVDASDRIYVADLGNNRICRIDDMSGANFVAYSGPMGNTFNGPGDVEIDGSGRILVGERNGDRVVRFDDMAGTNFVAYNGPMGNALNNVNGLAVDRLNGQIFIVDTDNNRLVCVDDISGSGFITFGTLGLPIDVAIRP